MGIPLDDSGDWQATYQQLQSEGTGEDHSVRLIETPVFSRTPIRRGIDANMSFGSQGNGGAPTVPYPIRSSLAQMISIWRAQASHYFSTIRRGSPEQLDQMGIGHLFAKTEQLPYMSPYRGQVDKVYPKPSIRIANGLGRVGKGGIMGVRPRFDKALRTIDYSYKPPVYGEGE